MDASDAKAPWLFLDGFPVALNVLCWASLLTLIAVLWRRSGGGVEDGAAGPSDGKSLSANARQNRAYKRGGALLLVLGAAGGFLPSLTLLAVTGKVWSVNRVEPHTDVDASLVVHIPLAVIFAIAMGFQLWSGGIGARIRLHRVGGWIAVASVMIGVSLAAGWVWTYFNDFVHGLWGPRARAGYYTVILGLGAAVNAVLLVVYARRRKFLIHKDFALMTLFWTLDPGVHRFFMWMMRMLTWDWWAPETTGGLGIALAKLPANLVLIVWALTMATRAGRLNKIIIWNAAGQFLLFCYGSFGLMQRTIGAGMAGPIVLSSIGLGLAALIVAKRQGVILRP